MYFHDVYGGGRRRYGGAGINSPKDVDSGITHSRPTRKLPSLNGFRDYKFDWSMQQCCYLYSKP